VAIEYTQKNTEPTYEDIQAHINKFNLDGVCSQCNNTVWQLYGGEQDMFAPIFLLPYKKVLQTHNIQWRNFTAFVLICNQCGYTKFFTKYFVNKMEKKEDGEDGA
jgi:predicted nucleic-acid-binding Zn-ribbon protein